MTSQETDRPAVSPDDKCMVCGQARDMHGDLAHKFSIDGQLIPNAPAAPPKKEAPRERGDTAAELAKDIQANATMRLVEVLIERGVLDGKDTMYIFSGFKSE